MSDLARLRADSLLAEKMWGRTMAGLTAITYREKGETAFLQSWYETLRNHQTTHFLEGLRKLGIRDDEPPAVKACKYHYFTNLIGGLKMEYIKESPRKCWIRYLAPMWTYAGVAMLAMPPHTRRTMGSAWHPRNGQLLGSPNLQYVRTKTIIEGDPYDEGYWVEHDRPLAPEETLLFKIEIRTPEFDPDKAPRLDPVLWPEERKLKARPKFAGGYVSRLTTVLLSKFGLDSTAYIVSQTMKCIAIQYIHELRADQGITGSDLDSVVGIFTGILQACRQDFTVERPTGKRVRIVLKSYRPFDWEVPEELRDALFDFQRMGTRVLNGRIRATRRVEPDWGPVEREIWEFEDTGRWLWWTSSTIVRRPPEAAGYASERACRALEAEVGAGNLGDLVDQAAMRWGDRAAAVFFDDGVTLSYAELARRVNRLADGLARIGVGFGSFVGLMLHTDQHYPLAWLAVAKLGAVAVPINPAYTAREVAFVLADSGAGFLVVDRGLLAALPTGERSMPSARNVVVAGGHAAPYRSWEDVEATGADRHLPARAPQATDLVNIQYTSGTTGLPKGAMIPHGYWLLRGRMWTIQAGRPIAHNLIAQPFHYVDGQAHFMLALAGGGTAHVARRQSASRFLAWVKAFGIEFCSMPELVARQPEDPSDGRTALKMIYAYSHRPENYRGYEARFGCPVRQGYGMTELGSALYVPVEADHMTGSGTVGIPSACREAMIGDETGRPVPPGVEGEILVRGRHILLGYHNRPDATAAAFDADGWFRTGDVGRQDADGWFHYLGRRKDMIRRSSENISAVEVEAVLRGVPGIAEAAVLPVPDAARGEEVKAYVRVEEGRSPEDVPPAIVLAHCAGNLARYKIPRYLEYVAEFPRTAGGKIRKVDLIAGRSDLRAGAYDAVEGVWRPL